MAGAAWKALAAGATTPKQRVMPPAAVIGLPNHIVLKKAATSIQQKTCATPPLDVLGRVTSGEAGAWNPRAAGIIILKHCAVVQTSATGTRTWMSACTWTVGYSGGQMNQHARKMILA